MTDTVRPSGLPRVFHPPKLERKHSSGDLQSRLKTRKILGVGETDNGDVHRSKISQLLGHNEHLYVRFPRGFWFWHLFMASIITIQGVLALLLPGYAYSISFLHEPIKGNDAYFAVRLHGAALLALSLCLWKVVPKIQCSYTLTSIASFLWNFHGTNDKAQARCALAAMMLYQFLLLGVFIMSLLELEVINNEVIGSLAVRILLAITNFIYFQSIGRSTAGIKKSTSYKDLSCPTPSTSPKDDKKTEVKKDN